MTNDDLYILYRVGDSYCILSFASQSQQVLLAAFRKRPLRYHDST